MPWGASFAALLIAPAWANGITQRVSVGPHSMQSSLFGVSSRASISATGRFVAFESNADNLVPGDTIVADVFLRDRWKGTTRRMSLGPGGVPGNGDSTGAILTTGARYVGFSSLATNLVAGDANGHWDAFVRDRGSNATERVSVSSSGLEGNADSYLWSLSQGGRYAVIVSDASNLVSDDTNGASDVFIRDRRSGTTSLISAGLGGAPADGGSFGAVISSNGKFVALQSQAANLVPDDKNGRSDIFLRNLSTGTTTLVSTDSRGKQGDGDSYDPSLSADGRFVTFYSWATNLVPGDTNGFSDIFVHDRLTGRTERVSVTSRGTQGEGGSVSASISADGRFVAFESSDSKLVRGDSNEASDIFLRDRDRGTTRLLSVGPSGVEGNQSSESPRISADGSTVAFDSQATNLVPHDTNEARDVFVRIPNP